MPVKITEKAIQQKQMQRSVSRETAIELIELERYAKKSLASPSAVRKTLLSAGIINSKGRLNRIYR